LKPVASQARFEFSLQIEQRVEWISIRRDHIHTLDLFVFGALLLHAVPIWDDVWHCQEAGVKECCLLLM
jgi:hypothetical protein